MGRRFLEQEPLVSEKIMLAKEHLIYRYNKWDGSGHQAGLVVIELRDRAKVVSQT